MNGPVRAALTFVESRLSGGFAGIRLNSTKLRMSYDPKCKVSGIGSNAPCNTIRRIGEAFFKLFLSGLGGIWGRLLPNL